ncbi:MAG: MATE family efflux transporter [Saprospiraceae bacterium]|nr:MATE family efflux transporter [Saprospiraceae bacterium]
MKTSQDLGIRPIGNLLTKMAVPASIGILVMSIYFIVDTIFVGRFVGTLGIAAITVVMPIMFLISSMGMAIGVGGSSVISRALGGDNYKHAGAVFGNMISLTLAFALLLVGLGTFFMDEVLNLFGAKGAILEPARVYFKIVLLGVPFLAWAMMTNNIMRAEGAPKMAMLVMLIPAVANIILDPILIIYFDWGLAGAAWATTISYFGSAGFSIWFFFFSGRSELPLSLNALKWRFSILKEISAIGSVTLARQGTISLLTIVLNHSLFQYGNELAVAIFGIINRISMFANFPVLGITQGFLPIAGYNYGAKNWARVRQTLRISIRTGTLIALGIFTLILLFSKSFIALFTTDPALLEPTPKALILVFMATPLIVVQLIGSAYFQAVGKALPALLLTMSKQGFFLIPLVLILPSFYGLNGIWYSFPIADVLAASVTYWYLQREIRKNLPLEDYTEIPESLEASALSANEVN